MDEFELPEVIAHRSCPHLGAISDIEQQLSAADRMAARIGHSAAQSTASCLANCLNCNKGGKESRDRANLSDPSAPHQEGRLYQFTQCIRQTVSSDVSLSMLATSFSAG